MDHPTAILSVSLCFHSFLYNCWGCFSPAKAQDLDFEERAKVCVPQKVKKTKHCVSMLLLGPPTGVLEPSAVTQ
ncbi:hypothetical protein mRhiFer1_009796 [Rhinolophus ferrumequinum]|uniref:Secreted protein n=1 Tax=Rhinolophus ferrumequinum TaxID=59479 RepID=A0A7J7ZED3_RHIFE|nr:hypothetical protein mRhiFer1_009796 [Rhinolophus ferrumequinum]